MSTDKGAFAAMTRAIYLETNPYNARRLVQYHGREAAVVESAGLAARARRDRSRVWIAVYAAAASELRPREDSGVRGGQGLDSDHAGLLRRLCLLLDHRPRGADRPEPQCGVDSGRSAPHGRGPRFFGHDQRPRRADGQHVRDELLEAGSARDVQAIELLAADDLSDAGDRSRAAAGVAGGRARQPGVKRALVASGVRMDLALRSPAFIRQIARHHTGGLLRRART